MYEYFSRAYNFSFDRRLHTSYTRFNTPESPLLCAYLITKSAVYHTMHYGNITGRLYTHPPVWWNENYGSNSMKI